jgi:hypothetical protein
MNFTMMWGRFFTNEMYCSKLRMSSTQESRYLFPHNDMFSIYTPTGMIVQLMSGSNWFVCFVVYSAICHFNANNDGGSL